MPTSASSRATPSASSSLIVPHSRITLGPPLTSDHEPSPSQDAGQQRALAFDRLLPGQVRDALRVAGAAEAEDACVHQAREQTRGDGDDTRGRCVRWTRTLTPWRCQYATTSSTRCVSRVGMEATTGSAAGRRPRCSDLRRDTGRRRARSARRSRTLSGFQAPLPTVRDRAPRRSMPRAHSLGQPQGARALDVVQSRGAARMLDGAQRIDLVPPRPDEHALRPRRPDPSTHAHHRQQLAARSRTARRARAAASPSSSRSPAGMSVRSSSPRPSPTTNGWSAVDAHPAADLRAHLDQVAVVVAAREHGHGHALRLGLAGHPRRAPRASVAGDGLLVAAVASAATARSKRTSRACPRTAHEHRLARARSSEPPKPMPACRNFGPMRSSSPMPARDLDDVGAGLLADVGDLVDEGDLGGQEGVRGELDHLRRADVRAHERRVERRVELHDRVAGPVAVVADDDAVGLQEVRAPPSPP